MVDFIVFSNIIVLVYVFFYDPKTSSNDTLRLIRVSYIYFKSQLRNDNLYYGDQLGSELSPPHHCSGEFREMLSEFKRPLLSSFYQ